LTIYTLQNGSYIVSPASLALPPLTASNIERFLQLHPTTGENSLIRKFRQWLISHDI
jgi:hypothetical protein